MSAVQKIELPIGGMDCTECTEHVQHAIAALPGVNHVTVLLAAEKAIVTLDPARVNLPMIRQAVAGAGYSVPEIASSPAADSNPKAAERSVAVSRQLGLVLLIVFGVVLLVVLGGEWLGVFEEITARVPFVLGALLVLLAGAPIFRNVLRAAWRRQVISHTLMSVGVLAALAVGQWVTALVVILFMYVGNYVESFTTDRARQALRDLNALAPQTAHVERDGVEQTVPVAQVQPGDVVVVRPGEKIPVDGDVVAGQATVNQATLTGEAMPVEVGVGAHVYAATTAQLGSLRIRAAQVGRDTMFGHVIQLVQEAEANRAEVQRFADRFSAYYLPVVLAFAAVTLVVRRDPLAVAAVLVVACSCSIALATPVAMLASLGAAARRGILLKGGKVIETLVRADVVLLDKTGTLTLGKPQLTDILACDGVEENELLALAAAVESESEHPLARAVQDAATARRLHVVKSNRFRALPGVGVRGMVGTRQVEIGKERVPVGAALPARAEALQAQGKTLLYVRGDGELLGILAASDVLRPEVPGALAQLRELGVRQIELLTGDHASAAALLAQPLGISFRADLLPQDKIRIVREYQAQGKRVVMVGDGVNDAPALAQADVGIAMGSGTDVAMEAAHVVLLRDDWTLVPEVLRIAQRTMRVVQLNLGLTAVYNLVGLSLAALGILPPVLAAAAQSLPDLGILANSSRLLRQK